MLLVLWDGDSRMQTEWWWIEMSEGNKGGRIPNWLTDLLSQIEWAAWPSVSDTMMIYSIQIWGRGRTGGTKSSVPSIPWKHAYVTVYLCVHVLIPSEPRCAPPCLASVILFTQPVTRQSLFPTAWRIPGCNILIFPFMLHIRPTISLANEVWN